MTFPQTRLSGEPEAAVQARQALLEAEIELMHHRERVAELRRQLPPGPVVADYVFEEGPEDLGAGDAPVHQTRLSELFSLPDRSLIVYHFMYGKEQGAPCPMCTMWIDGYNAVADHLAHNVDFVIAAAASPAALRAHARTRGWHHLRLLSCGDSTFKYDLRSEDEAGNQDSAISVFTMDPEGNVRHSYTGHPSLSPDIDQRGIDLLTPVWSLLDLTPKGRGDWYPSLP